MNEKDDKLNKGSFLYIGDQDKAEWGYPEGYPHKGMGEVEVLPETSLSLTEVSGTFFCTPNIPLYIEVGKQYKVIWDGSEYLVEGKEAGDENQTMQYIGNAAIPGGGGEDTGEPFLITSMHGSPQCFGTSAGEYTVSISEYSETIHSMAPDFLPQANQTTYGAIKKAAHVPHVTEAPTSNDFNKLLSALREAGIMRQSE